MQIILKEPDNYVLRLDTGDEVLTTLKEFCRVESITGGFFYGIGAAGEALLSWYNISHKVYLDKHIIEELEIAGLQGNIALLGNEFVIHAHGSVSDKNFQTHSGHFKKLVVSATCEIWLRKFINSMHRAPDGQTGLNFLTK